jgi:hypothetical protein
MQLLLLFRSLLSLVYITEEFVAIILYTIMSNKLHLLRYCRVKTEKSFNVVDFDKISCFFILESTLQLNVQFYR